MTKREFYENYAVNPDVNLDDLSYLISEYDLYDDIELKTDSDFADWMDDEIRDRLSYENWKMLRDWLEGVCDDAPYYLFIEGCFRYGIYYGDELYYIIETIENALSYACDDWDDDDPDDEENNQANSVESYIPPLLNFEPEETFVGNINFLI